MLFTQRKQLHRTVAEWYETTHAGDLSPYYPLLAHHYSQAEDQETAREERPVIQTQLQQVRVGSLYGIKAGLETVMNACEDASRLFLFGMLIALLMLGCFLLHQVHD